MFVCECYIGERPCHNKKSPTISSTPDNPRLHTLHRATKRNEEEEGSQ